jgi:hypothetical protein
VVAASPRCSGPVKGPPLFAVIFNHGTTGPRVILADDAAELAGMPRKPSRRPAMKRLFSATSQSSLSDAFSAQA